MVRPFDSYARKRGVLERGERRVIFKMPVHGSLYRFGKRPIRSELNPVSVA